VNGKDNLDHKPEHQQIWARSEHFNDQSKVKVNSPFFFGCNSFVDSEIGRVLTAIDQFVPNALVIYTTDHGDMLHSHGLGNKGPAMYDEIVNIPFLVRWNESAPKGTVSKSIISHIDLAPTVLDYFGLSKSKILEGKSLLSLLTKPTIHVNNEVFIEFGRYEIDHDGFGGFQPIRCAVNDRYKLVINLLSTDEFYDLQVDAGEIQNLIDTMDPELEKVRNRLHDKLLDWMNATRDPFRGYYWECRHWRKDAKLPTWGSTGMTRQREEDERYEPRQLDYNTGLPIEKGHRKKA
jgi:uncharacterized sulfatase